MNNSKRNSKSRTRDIIFVCKWSLKMEHILSNRNEIQIIVRSNFVTFYFAFKPYGNDWYKALMRYAYTIKCTIYRYVEYISKIVKKRIRLRMCNFYLYLLPFCVSNRLLIFRVPLPSLDQ